MSIQGPKLSQDCWSSLRTEGEARGLTGRHKPRGLKIGSWGGSLSGCGSGPAVQRRIPKSPVATFGPEVRVAGATHERPLIGTAHVVFPGRKARTRALCTSVPPNGRQIALVPVANGVTSGQYVPRRQKKMSSAGLATVASVGGAASFGAIPDAMLACTFRSASIV